jgi:hypothetical protein
LVITTAHFCVFLGALGVLPVKTPYNRQEMQYT